MAYSTSGRFRRDRAERGQAAGQGKPTWDPDAAPNRERYLAAKEIHKKTKSSDDESGIPGVQVTIENQRRLLVAVKPPKPINEMSAEERRAFAEELGDAMAAPRVLVKGDEISTGGSARLAALPRRTGRVHPLTISPRV